MEYIVRARQIDPTAHKMKYSANSPKKIMHKLI